MSVHLALCELPCTRLVRGADLEQRVYDDLTGDVVTVANDAAMLIDGGFAAHVLSAHVLSARVLAAHVFAAHVFAALKRTSPRHLH